MAKGPKLPKAVWVLMCSHGYVRRTIFGPKVFTRKPHSLRAQGCLFVATKVKLEVENNPWLK